MKTGRKLVSAYRYRLDLQLFSGEKTEPATPKKRQEARKKGQVAKSMELPGAFILFFCFLAFILFGGFMKEKYIKLFRVTFHDYMGMEVTISNVNSLFGNLLVESLLLLAPIFLVAVLIALVGNYLQIGILFTGDPLLMKFNKINPLEGAKRIFSLRTAVDFLKSILKLAVIGVVVYSTIMGSKDQILGLSRMPLANTMSFVSGLTVQLGIKIGLILIVLAAFDYMYQRYEHEKNLKMSKQDIKDEYKKSEGDPLVKGKIKERQRRMAMQRMMQDVPKADVIITNPTHYAIAIKYESGMEAPKVLAKGTDFIAQKIKEVGREHGIVLMENRPLARALHDQVEIGQSIPADLFQAVAEVLAYVYKLKGRSK
ncbi:flagellar biosynthesis protein FlhB [Paenibacillus aurantius]|uniref:Flagellar biosynthetic protein FlhB n=1 Tax=Paenibacillus aurantius TaxID=2918900 RepID=A0AA96LI41_9BACL|nr:flagellar biosynthesis protein FlhB [Paenibacillus aurantius]WNQ13748.1 flagellar biosynthesis protein FlhB [Paenibacillus aurantius]